MVQFVRKHCASVDNEDRRHVGRHDSPEAFHLKLPEWVHTARREDAALPGSRTQRSMAAGIRLAVEICGYFGVPQLAGAADGFFLARADWLFRR